MEHGDELGPLPRRSQLRDPEVRAAEVDWENALTDLYDVHHGRRAVELTPLMRAAERVGLTWEEWHGLEPYVPRRRRFRRGMEPTDDAWAAAFRDELADWVRARRA